MSQDVTITLKLDQVRQFVQDSRSGARAMDDVGDAVERTNRRSRLASIASGGLGMLRSTLGAVATGAKYLGGAMFAGGTAAAVFGVKADAAFEQAQIGMTTMLGSAEKANRFLTQMQSFANTTPFEFTQLVSASQKLLAFGFAASQIKPMLTTIGDTAAGLSLGADGIDRITLAIGQMQAKTKVQGDELLQLTEAGIPALQILAKGLHMSTAAVSKAISKGEVSAKVAIPLLLAGMNQQFGGLMDKQSKSLEGQWSNFHDNLTTTARQLARPFRPMLASWLTDLNDAMPTFRKKALVVARRAARDLPRIVDNFRAGSPGAAAMVVGDWFGSRSEGATKVANAVFSAVKRIVDYVRDPKISLNLRSLGHSLGTVSESMSRMGGGVGDGVNNTLSLFNSGLRIAAKLGGQMSWILPTLAAGFLAVKASQAVTSSLPWKGAELVSTVALAASNFALAHSIDASTLATVRQTAVGRIAAVATKGWAAAQWLLNAAMSPLGLVIIVIAAIAIGLVLLYRHSERFRNIVHAAGRVAVRAFGWVWDKITAVFGWVKKHWPLLLGILTGPIGLAVVGITKYKDQIVGVVKALVNTIIRLWNGLDLTMKIPGWVSKIPGIPDGIAGASIDLIPDVPYLASGGRLTSGGSVMVGEKGPELLDLPRGATVTPLDPPGKGGSLRDALTIVAQLVVDRKVMAEVAIAGNGDVRARR